MSTFIVITLATAMTSVTETIQRKRDHKRTKAQNKRATAHFEPFKEGVSYAYNY